MEWFTRNSLVNVMVHPMIHFNHDDLVGLKHFQVKIPSESCLDAIPEDIYHQACVYSTEEAVASCQVVGYPAMIKASWGGGGKGIRKVCIVRPSMLICAFPILWPMCEHCVP